MRRWLWCETSGRVLWRPRLHSWKRRLSVIARSSNPPDFVISVHGVSCPETLGSWRCMAVFVPVCVRLWPGELFRKSYSTALCGSKLPACAVALRQLLVCCEVTSHWLYTWRSFLCDLPFCRFSALCLRYRLRRALVAALSACPHNLYLCAAGHCVFLSSDPRLSRSIAIIKCADRVLPVQEI